jgi:IS30 family transposase
MSHDSALPQRAARLTEAQQLQICRLALRQVPQVEIAQRIGCHRNTVRRVLIRTRAALAVNEDTTEARADAIATLREVQRTAWEDMETARARGRSTAMLLAEVRLAQQQINGLLGLEEITINHRTEHLARVEAILTAPIPLHLPGAPSHD